MIEFEETLQDLKAELLESPTLNVEEWQGLRGEDIPQNHTRELLNVYLQFRIPPDLSTLGMLVYPDLPWAEDHFQERVGGQPLNPGEQYKNWPGYISKSRGGVEDHKTSGKFSHTYMERFWPKDVVQAGKRYGSPDGIRYDYGDLGDVVDLLARSPYTRQAYLPIWFPEDTGAVHGGRVPCTLGYHFLLRDNKLHLFYPIRSCDVYRHFRNDVYMAARLCQWMIGKAKKKSTVPHDEHDCDFTLWEHVNPGTLTMWIGSFHCFEGDIPKLRKELGQ